MKYISIDLETTGTEPRHNQVIEFAAVIDDFSWLPSVKRPAMNFLVKHKRYVCSPYAAALHKDLWTRLADPDLMVKERVALPYEVGRWLNHFASQHEIPPYNIVAAGKNFAKFDLPFLLRLPEFNREVAFNHRSLDPMMLYMSPLDEVPPSTEECLRRAGLPTEVSHKALGDALSVIQLLRAHFLHVGLTSVEYVVE